jgi:flagellin
MARINTNVASLTAQRGLAKSSQQLTSTLQRLSSGLKINSGADDPAGLIASEGLRSEISGINQGIDNSTRATNVIATAEGALSEVANLLLNVKSLIVQAANGGAFSSDEIAANQLQIDSAVQSITRISNTTSFAGLQLLNGNLDYITSGVDSNIVKALAVHQASFGTATSIPVAINVTTSAKVATLKFATSSITADTNLQINGAEGVKVIHLGAGESAAAVAAAINEGSDSTGVTAALINPANANSGIILNSTDYGSKAFVSVSILGSGSFNTIDTSGAQRQRAYGGDAVATINGQSVGADGRNLKVNSGGLDLDLSLDKTFGVGSTSFAITGGGALFQLGPKVNSNQQVSIALGSIAASHLGDNEVGFLSDISSDGNKALTTGNPAIQAQAAEKVIETAITQIAVLRGRLGAFQKNTLETNVNSLNVALENVTSSESTIVDADFAAETSNLTRAQILTQAGTSVLATANSTPQSVLKLLQ